MMSIVKILAIAAAALYCGALMGRYLFPKKQAYKFIERKVNYPMGDHTFPVACSVCKHNTGEDDDAIEFCCDCFCEVRSGFEMDKEIVFHSRDKLNIEVQVLREKCDRLTKAMNAMKWMKLTVSSPAANEVVWVIRRIDDLEIVIDKDSMDEDGNWASGSSKPVLYWREMPELPDL